MSTPEVREPSPDDDVIVVSAVGQVQRCGIHPALWHLRSGLEADRTWSEVCDELGPIGVYVPASRLAAAEAQRDDLLAENEQQLQEITDLREQLEAASTSLLGGSDA